MLFLNLVNVILIYSTIPHIGMKGKNTDAHYAHMPAPSKKRFKGI